MQNDKSFYINQRICQYINNISEQVVIQLQEAKALIRKKCMPWKDNTRPTFTEHF